MRLPLIATALLLMPGACDTQSPAKIVVSDGWARATAPGQDSAAGYLRLENRGGGDRLVAVRSPAARRVTLHQTMVSAGISRMREIAGGIEIGAGQSVALAPGGAHIMLTGLAAPLRRGERVPLILSFRRSGDITSSLAVREAGAMTGGHDGH